MCSWVAAGVVFLWCLACVRTQCPVSAIFTLHHDLRAKWANYKHHQVWKVSQFDSCKPHHFCPSWLAGRKKFFACGYGFYNNKRDSESYDDCLPCPAGKYCLAGVYDCEPGYYCPENGLPKEPWPGYYAPHAGMSEPIECPPGTYQPIVQHIQWEWRGVAECLPCPIGKFCDTTRLHVPAGPCNDGYYCGVGETSPQRAEEKCPIGYACFSGKHKNLCGNGNYQDEEGSHYCAICPEGKYCNSHFGPTGNCSEGWYCSFYEHTPEPSGQFCPVGHMCPEAKLTPCGKGYYQPNTGQLTCLPCPVGKYCASTNLTAPSGNCNPGCCLEPAQITAASCPPGSPSSCTQGYYEDGGSCVPCPEGKYCAISGLYAPSGTCAPGWYCESGEISPMPLGKYCPAGHYCPKGKKIACGKIGGKYYHQQYRGQTQCSTCRFRFNCTETAIVIPTKVCGPGYNCIYGQMRLCKANNYCLKGIERPCFPGFEQPNVGQSECIRCPDGYVCENGVRSPCPTNMVCYNGFAHYCELGYICSFENGAHVKTPCPPGTERYDLKATSCTPCRENRYCRSASSYECFRYHEGFFCEGGADKPFVTSTQPGQYYKLNETLRAYTKEYCAPGTYTPYIHSSECLPCPHGKYCDGTGLTEPSGNCSAGYYCGEGSTTPVQHDCTAGCICPYGLQYRCPAGYYCSTTGLTTPTAICPVEHMCPKGSAAPTPCPDGTSQPQEGQSVCI